MIVRRRKSRALDKPPVLIISFASWPTRELEIGCDARPMVRSHGRNRHQSSAGARPDGDAYKARNRSWLRLDIQTRLFKKRTHLRCTVKTSTWKQPCKPGG